jgi:hypothetical protein
MPAPHYRISRHLQHRRHIIPETQPNALSRNPTDLLTDQVHLLSDINLSIARLEQSQAQTATALADLAVGVRLTNDQHAAPAADQDKPLEGDTGSLSAVHVVNGIVIVGFVLLTYFWVSVGVWQIYFGVQLAKYSDVVGIQPEVITGVMNIFLSFINIVVINSIVNRRRDTVLGIWLIVLLSVAWGIFQLIGQGALLQAIAVPIYLVSAMLITVNRNYFLSPQSA